MKYCQIFKNKLDCNNADDVFNCLINNLKETIKTWDYFVNWDKVIKNYRDVEVSLNLLNTLIGKDDIETAARELLKEYPKVIGVIPALLAYRERKVKLLSDVSKFSITEYDFAKTIDVDKAVMFLKKTGFLRLLSDRNIKSIPDYFIGVEVGLDSNGRKNRSGTSMEDIAEFFIKDICQRNGFEYIAQATADKIKKKWNRRLFEEYAKGGRTLQDITNLARTLGLCSKMCTVKKTISRAQVQNILKNTFYIGYFKQKGKVYKHNYPLFIDEDLFRIVQDTMEDRKRAPSKLYYGDKQYIFSGLVRCGCCGSLMTCETKVKDDKHSYNYLKCNKLRSKCSQKPINEAKVLKQLEQELSLPLAISDDMLKNIKAEVKKQLKEENINTASLKRDITIKLSGLDEQLKTLFRGYIQGKCDEKMYNELKTEIELEKEKLQKDMDRYLEIDTDTDEMLANIAEIAANVGKFLKSPIISQKRDILNLILSDCKTEGKNLCFSIAKPFDKLLKTPEINKWCR